MLMVSLVRISLKWFFVKGGTEVKSLSYYNFFNYWGWLEDLDCLNDLEVLTGEVVNLIKKLMNSNIENDFFSFFSQVYCQTPKYR